MKPHELASRLGISPVTLREWVRESFGEFLSPAAQGANGTKRSFSTLDAQILTWIAQMKAENVPSTEITINLRKAQAEGWRALPPLPPTEEEMIALVPREAVEERIKALQEQTRLQVAALEKERDDLRSQLTKMETVNSELRQDNNELRRQMFELNQRVLQLTDRMTALWEKDQKRRK